MAASSERRGRRFGISYRAKAAPRQSPRLCRLGFETLEDRALLSVSLSLNGPQTIVPGATTNVSNDITVSQSEMSLVVNPTNPLNVVGFSHRIENPITVEVYSSVDGGLNWSVSEIDNADDGLGAVGNRFDPAVQFDANGVLYIAYGHRGQATAPLRNTRLVVARSNDGGVTFGNYISVDQQPDILTASPTDTDTPGLDKWYFATGIDPISGNQAVYLAYVAFVTEGMGMGAGTDAHISVIGSRDGGTNWTPRLVINDDAAVGAFDSASYASPIVDSLGRLAVSWGDTDDTSIMIDRDMDGLWSNVETFGNDVTVRTGIDVARSTVLPPAQPTRGVNAAPMLEVWRAVNWLYIPVVEKYQGSSTDLDIWVGVSSDFGANWTFNRIDDSGGTEFNPWLQVDQTSGAVNVLYYTTDGDVGTGNDDVRPRLAMSNDGGATWTRNFLSTQQSNESVGTPANGNYGGDYLEYHGLAVRDGTAHGLWPSRYPAGGNDLDAFTANAAFVSSTGDNRLIIGERGGVDDSFLIQQSPANPAFLEVFVDGVREFTGLSATLDKIIINPGGGINTFNIGSLTGISSVTFNGTSNLDTYDIVSLGLNAPLTIVLGGGDDTVTLGSSPFASQLIQSPVTIFGDTGNDTVSLGSNNSDSIDANITFNGGTSTSATGDRLVFNDTAPTYNISYDIASAVVTRDGLNLPHTVGYSSVEGIIVNAGSGADTVTVRNDIPTTVTANGNDGNDNFIVGDGNLTSRPAIFTGGNGTDQITFDDRLDLGAKIWNFADNQVNFGSVHPLVPLDTTGFESVGVLAGSGQDEFDFKGVLGQSFNVDGGPNTDTFVLGYQGSVFFSNTVTLLGGTGGDVFTVNDAAVSAFTTPLVMDGGDDFNSMNVNEPLATGYYLGPGYFTPRTGASNQGTFTFGNMLTTVFTGNSGDNDFTIYSAGVSIGTFTINGGSGHDTFVLAPQLSGYSFKGLTLNGQPGTDTFALDATGLFTNESYTIGTNTLAIARGGVDFDNVTISSMDSVTLNCGLGNDSIFMSQYSAGIPVTVNGGFGDDTMNVGGGNLPANITNISAFTFNGQNGLDTFNLNNTSEPNQWTYTALGPTIRSERVAGAAYYIFAAGQTGVEQLNVNAGSGIDVMTLTAVPVGQTLAFNGANGGDALNLPGDLSTILGPVYFEGGAGSNNVNQISNSSTTPATVHVDQTSVGATPGDSFFPAGASLHFANVANVVLTMGSGADSAFVQPNLNTVISIRGGNPTTAPGDTLNLILSTAQNYVINGTPANGSVTSSNLQTLSYTGFETGPNVSDANFDGDVDVDGADFLAWQRGLGKPAAMNADGDANNDQDVDGDDLVAWRAHFGIAGAAIAASSSDAVMASLAESNSTSSGALSAEWVDAAVAKSLAADSTDDPMDRVRDRHITFLAPSGELQQGLDIANHRRITADSAEGRRGRDQRRVDKLSLRSFGDDRRDTVVLEALFARLL